VVFINVLDSLTAPCLVYNMAIYTVYSRFGQYGQCMFHTQDGAAGAWFIRTLSCWILAYNYAIHVQHCFCGVLPGGFVMCSLMTS